MQQYGGSILQLTQRIDDVCYGDIADGQAVFLQGRGDAGGIIRGARPTRGSGHGGLQAIGQQQDTENGADGLHSHLIW